MTTRAVEEQPPLRRVRWSLIGFLLGGVVVACVISGSPSHRHLSVCSDKASGASPANAASSVPNPTPEAAEPAGNSASAVTCRALQTTDPQILVAVLIAMLLLLPDVQSLKIAGLVEVQRSAKKAADAANRATEAAATLTAHARALSHSSAIASVTVTSADTVPPGVDWDADEQSLAEKRRRFLEQS